MNLFWGWSSPAYMRPLEYKLRYDPTDLSGKVRPIAMEELGTRFSDSSRTASQLKQARVTHARD